MKKQKVIPSLKNTLKTISTKAEVFSLLPAKPEKIKSKSGMTIQFPKDALILSSGIPAKGPVKIALKTVLKPYDFFTSSIPMTYQEKGKTYLFESGGMFKISATYKGKNLTLAKNKNIKVTFPYSVPKKGFKLFYRKEGRWNLYAPRIRSKTKAHSSASIKRKKETIFINQLAYWNIDRPVDDLAFIKVNFNHKKIKKTSLIRACVLGMDHNSITWRTSKPGSRFVIKTLNNKKAKVIALAKGGYVACSPVITINKNTKQYPISYNRNVLTLDIGQLQFKKVPDYIYKNPLLLARHLGLFNKIFYSQVLREQIYLKNGTLITGKILCINKTILIIRSHFGTITIARDKINRIEYLNN